MTAIILKGCHYSLMIPWIFYSQNVSLSYDIIFQDSCRYEVPEPSCVNKLFGVTHGIFGVHKNSDRFGWTYNAETDRIDIWSYYYSDSKLKKKVIGSVGIGQENRFELRTGLDRELVLSINGEETKISAQGEGKSWHVLLTPYFGGNSVAPHVIKIEMNRNR